MGAYEDTLQRIAAGATPWKLAVRVCSTSNVTLAGLQTIDGVALAEGDRVLCAGQTLPAESGVYIASVAAWVRASDFDRSSYVKLGTTIRAMEGAANASKWVLTTPTDGEIRVGVTSLAFSAEGKVVEVVGDTLNSSAFQSLLSGLVTAGVVTDSTSNVLGSVGVKGWLTANSVRVADAAVVPTWLDKVSSLDVTEATNRPIFRASSINGHPAVDFDGTNDKLVSSAVATSWFGPVGDFSIVAAVHADAVVSVAGTFADEAIFSEGNTRISMLLFLNGADYTLRGCVYDGAFKYASKVIGTSLPAVGFVAEMRLVGGNLIMSVDGVDGTPVACGPPDVYGSFVRVGSNAGGTAFLNGQIAELVTYSVGTKQTATINAFLAKYVP